MLIYASSCKDYYAAHGEAFIRSAMKHGHRVKVDMADTFSKKELKCDSQRTFNCFVRFLRLPEMLEQDDVLVMDIDSIINQPIIFNCDMALFFRPWVPSHRHDLKVLLTVSYWSKASKPFAERVRERLLGQVNKWGDDQAVVWRTYLEMGDRFDIKSLDQDFANYYFDREAPIWTCKGPGRKDNEVYLARKNAYH